MIVHTSTVINTIKLIKDLSVINFMFKNNTYFKEKCLIDYLFICY
jgi:hypothetical protein